MCYNAGYYHWAGIAMIEQTIDTINFNTKAARAGSAMRMRRCRARRRAGYRCLLIEISNDEVAGLTHCGLLRVHDQEDMGAIQAAIYDLFEQTIGRPS